MRDGAFTLAAALSVAGCATPQPASPAPARYLEMAEIDAGAILPAQRITIRLPEGYDGSDRRYPVLYMYDGQNLFDPATTHYGKAWMVQDVLDRMIAEGKAGPHIVVGLWSQDGEGDRYRQYLPKPAADGATGAMAAQVADYAAGKPIVSDVHLAWLADTLKPWVDTHFRTRPGASDTTIIGASMGGVMACYAAIARGDVFGRAACVSAHFPIGRPDAGSEQAAEAIAIWDAYLGTTLGAPAGRRIWMDHGTVGLDGFYTPYQEGVARRFEQLGWTRGADFEARVYEDAEHDEIFWNARLPDMLEFLWSD